MSSLLIQSPDDALLDRIGRSGSLPVLGQLQQQFLSDLSREILQSATVRKNRPLAAFGYWLRGLPFRKTSEQWETESGSVLRMPRGNVLHFAPSNIAVMGLYSWVPSLMVGNRNIVRFSGRSLPENSSTFDVMEKVLARQEYAPIRESLSFVSYDHSDEVTTKLSLWADTRVIWGGDASVATIRGFPLKARATEIAFGNRLSIAIISREAWEVLDESARQKLARSFAVDSLTFNQQACSSPKIVIWIGEQGTTSCTDVFWELVESNVADLLVHVGDRERLDKLIAAQIAASNLDGLRKVSADSSRLTRLRIPIEGLRDCLEISNHPGSGMFFECFADGLEEVFSKLPQHIQTVSYFGFDKVQLGCALSRAGTTGVDRVVPVGEALNFDLTWDGINLLEAFTRKVVVA